MREVFAVVYREYLIRWTSPLWLFFDMAVPLLYMVMFGVAFDKALGEGLSLGGESIQYNRFFLAGVLSMTCFGSAINQSYGFFIDRDNGIFYEFLTYPMTRSQFLMGKILFQCLMSVVQCALTLGLAVAALDIDIVWEYLPLTVGVVVLGTAGWFFFLAIFAFLIRRNDTFNTAINVAYFVLIFLSTTFYPIDRAPGWLRLSSFLNPLTWHTDTLRFLTVGIGTGETILFEAACFGAFVLVSFWFAVRTLQRAV